MKLEYPKMRAELLEYLGQLSNPGLCRPQKTEPDPLDYIVHFLFDDTSLSDEPGRALGYFLNNQEEVRAVSRVVSALDRVLDVHGTEQPDEFYLKQPEWQAVASTARKAYELLRGAG